MVKIKKGSKEAKEKMAKARAARAANKDKQAEELMSQIQIETIDFQNFYSQAKKEYIEKYKKDNNINQDPIITESTEKDLREQAIINALNYLLTK